MTITSAQRRAASHVGHVTRLPDGRWSGYLTDRVGNSFAVAGELSEIAGTQRIDLVATASDVRLRTASDVRLRTASDVRLRTAKDAPNGKQPR